MSIAENFFCTHDDSFLEMKCYSWYFPNLTNKFSNFGAAKNLFFGPHCITPFSDFT